MKLKHTMPYVFALVVSFGFAYWASLPSASTDEQKKGVFSIEAEQISSLVLISPEHQVRLFKPAGDERFWVDYKRQEKKKPDGTAELTAMSEVFLASERAKDYLARFAPLEVQREISHIKDTQLKDFGLSESTKHLVLKKSGGDSILDLTVGKNSYGSANMYMRDKKTDAVWLASGDLVADLERADLRFYQRNLQKFSYDEIRAVEVRVSGKTKEVLHSKKDGKGNLLWSDAKDPEKANNSMQSWFEKLERLKVASYVAKDDKARLDALSAIVELTFDSEKGEKEHLIIKKASDSMSSPARPSGRAPGDLPAIADYYVYSDFLKSYVKVPSARVEPLEKDLKQVFGL